MSPQLKKKKKEYAGTVYNWNEYKLQVTKN